jgi:hypothetical protein
MHTFTDNAGRVWTIAISVAAIKRVRGLLNVDLYKLVDDGFKSLGELLGDPVRLVDVLYVLCQDEANARNVSDEDFGRALGGDALHQAMDAFVEELIDFFPDPKVRQSLRTIIAEATKVRKRMLDRAEQVLASFDADREANRLLRSFGIAPVSSALTPDLSPSGNSS